MTVKQEIVKLLNDAANKAEVELTNEVNFLGGYGLALALSRKCVGNASVHKLAGVVVKIHDAIWITHGME